MDVLVVGVSLVITAVIAVGLFQRARTQAPRLQGQLGGEAQEGWLVTDGGVRVREVGNGQLEAQATVRVSGQVTVRTSTSGLRVSGDPALVAVARQKMAGVRSLELKDHTLVVKAAGGSTPKRFVERVQEMVDALEQPWARAWTRAGRARGLTLSNGRLSGTMGDLTVQVYVEDGQTFVEVQGDLRPLTAAHKDTATFDPSPTGNAVLDMTLAVQGADEPLDDAVVEAMMPVLHAFPGPTLQDGRVLLRMPGTVIQGLGDRIDEAVALARSISP